MLSLPIVGVTLAFVAGALIAVWFERRTKREAALPRPKPKPLPDDTYQKQRRDYIETYQKSMREYDRLIPWGSGGALVLSITIMDRIIQDPEVGTMWLLAAGWVMLLVALGSSIFSHYTSSRIFSSRRAILDIIQEGTPDDRKLELIRDEAIVQSAGWWTRILNVTAGACLLAGIAAIALFAFFNL